MDAELFNDWYHVADTNHDGVISGPEAVEFFQLSNLSQDTLFQVWNLVAGDNSSLTKPQFYSTLRLISLAQRSGGVLPEAQARSLLVGIGPVPPPPTLAGLKVPRATVTQQSWQAAPQLPGAPPPTPGVPGVSSGSAAAFPPMPLADAQRYRAMFRQLDADQDGYVQARCLPSGLSEHPMKGADCFAAFMGWGLGKGALKDIWEVVAGDEGRLSARQFLGCVYLMDLAKRGVPPLRSLPPGAAFPPVAAPGAPAAPLDASAFSLASLEQARRSLGRHDVFAHELPLPALPARALFAPPPPDPYDALSRGIPSPDAPGLSAVERARLAADAAKAQELDRELHQAQSEGQLARQREAFYQAALQELTLFKSRTSAALLQAQERAEKATSDAAEMEAQYSAAWAGAESNQAQGRALLDALTKARARKVDMQTKLEQLQKDIAELSSLTPEQAQAEEAATSALQEQVAAAEAERLKLEVRAEAVREQRRALEAALEEVQLSCAAGQADLAGLKRDLAGLEDKLKAEDSSAAADLLSLLKQAAEVRATLLSNARRAGIEVPEEALLAAGGVPVRGPGALQPLEWDNYVAVDAEDWGDFEDEGVTIVGDLATYKELLLAGGRHDAAMAPDQAGQLQPASSAEAGAGAPLQRITGSGHSDNSTAEHDFADGTASGLKQAGHSTSSFAGFDSPRGSASSAKAAPAPAGWAAFM